MIFDDALSGVDLLATYKMKPWWETIRTATMAVMASTSLLLLYKSDKDSLRCLPINANSSAAFTEPQFSFVNQKCTTEADFFVHNSWWITIVVTGSLFLANNFWEHVPYAANAFSRFRKTFDVVADYSGTTESLIRLVTTVDTPDSSEFERLQRTQCRKIVTHLLPKRENKVSWLLKINTLLDEVHGNAVRILTSFPRIELGELHGNASVCYGFDRFLSGDIKLGKLLEKPAEKDLQLMEFCEENASSKLEVLMEQVCHYVSPVANDLNRFNSMQPAERLRRLLTNTLKWCSSVLLDKTSDTETCFVSRVEALRELLALRQIENVRQIRELFCDEWKETAFQILRNIQADAESSLQLLRNKEEIEALEKTRYLFLSTQEIESEKWRKNADFLAYKETRNTASRGKLSSTKYSTPSEGALLRSGEKTANCQAVIFRFINRLEDPKVLERLESIRHLSASRQIFKLTTEYKGQHVKVESCIIDSIRMVEAYKQLLALYQVEIVGEITRKLRKQHTVKTAKPNNQLKNKEFNIKNLFLVRNFLSLLVVFAGILLYSFGIFVTNPGPMFVCSGIYLCIQSTYRTTYMVAWVQCVLMFVQGIIFISLITEYVLHLNDNDGGTLFFLRLCKSSGETKTVKHFQHLTTDLREYQQLIFYGLRKNLPNAAMVGDVGFFLFYLETTDDKIEKFLDSRFVQKNQDSNFASTIKTLQRFRTDALYGQGNTESLFDFFKTHQQTRRNLTSSV